MNASHSSTSAKAAPNPLVLIAFFCAMASVGIAALVFCLNREISALLLCSTVLMVASPAAMGIGMAKFMTRAANRTADS